jgi:hypothetical protein
MKRLILSKAFGLGRKPPSRYENRAGRIFADHDSEQFSHPIDAYFPRFPLLALNDNVLAVLVQNKVDAAVAARTAPLLNTESLLSKGFPYKVLKLLPGEIANAVDTGLPAEEVSTILTTIPLLPFRTHPQAEYNQGRGH